MCNTREQRSRGGSDTNSATASAIMCTHRPYKSRVDDNIMPWYIITVMTRVVYRRTVATILCIERNSDFEKFDHLDTDRWKSKLEVE